MTSTKPFNGKSVVITGASTGIGRSCALALDRAGFKVFAGVRKEADGESIRAEASDKLGWLHIDVTDHDSISRAVQRVEKEVGPAGLWGLVNNAGVAVSGPMELVRPEQLERQFRVNVFGTMAVIRAFIPLVERAGGRIVITGSQGGRLGVPMIGAYNASKHALEAIADALRMEIHRFGVKVSLLEPGSIKTPIWGKGLAEADAWAGTLSAEERERYAVELRATTRMAKLQERLAVSTAWTDRAFLHALTSSRPRARYLIGLDAWLNRLLDNIVPTFLKDMGIRAAARRLGRE